MPHLKRASLPFPCHKHRLHDKLWCDPLTEGTEVRFCIKKTQQQTFPPLKKVFSLYWKFCCHQFLSFLSTFFLYKLKRTLQLHPLETSWGNGNCDGPVRFGVEKKTEKKYISKKKSHHKTLSNYYCNTSGTVIRDGWLMFPFSFGDIRKLYKSSRLCLQDLQAPHVSQQMSSQVMLHTYFSL